MAFDDLIAPDFKTTDIYKKFENGKCPKCGSSYELRETHTGMPVIQCSGSTSAYTGKSCPDFGAWRVWKFEDGEWKIEWSDYDD